MKFFTKRADLPAETAARVPPGQYLTQKWPVLHYGPVPPFNPKTWDLRVFGNVENEFKLNWEEFQKLDQTTVTADMHCVTTWSRLDQHWEGIPFSKIIELAKPKADSKFVIAHSEYGFTANTPLEYCLRDLGVVSLVVTGCVAEIGVMPTVLHAIDLGFIPVVASDACGALTETSHQQAMKQFSATATVARSEEITRGWRDVPPHVES